MTDLLRVLPHFPVGQYARLISVIEHHQLSTSDLVTLEAADIGKRTRLPLLDVKRLCNAVLEALHADLGLSNPKPDARHQAQSKSGPDAGPESNDTARPAPEAYPQLPPGRSLRNTAASLSEQWHTISTLDPDLDRALGGGIPAGYVTEITGESGAGKTQFLLALLLSVQLPPPHGLGRPALYISTEAPLSTLRLAQMLSANPLFQRLPPSERPSLDNVISTSTPDLESQDHILAFQVPVEVERRRVGLLVLDSVAANYRADTSSSGPANTKTPASSLRHPHPSTQSRQTQEFPLATRSRPPPPHPINNDAKPPSSIPLPSSASEPLQPPPPLPPQPTSTPPEDTTTPPHHHPALLLDRQQNWFTGWGDAPSPYSSSPSNPFFFPPKTPSLGLVWTTQIAVRIALTTSSSSSWKRWMKVVFAPHVAATGPGLDGAIRFEVWMGGLRAVGEGGG
ncbi:P-loop containing nucleoside triphosphate hydrolase protein [Parathielavia hyrcaniae]|uniref:P-loop containing nucleoside triphosphate hydrolase protein n=1 Tax=Parathielavia hyrcaniae TaxID=113614 RepID=A0AAN6PUH6_9PEZI|nr:P-loop containing nucleoside triphosphate hydrolase protein [Parathielavia hyrcaniae]